MVKKEKKKWVKYMTLIYQGMETDLRLDGEILIVLLVIYNKIWITNFLI